MSAKFTPKTVREDIYTRITNGIVEQLERGVRPWFKPWNAEHTAGRITRPLRYNGEKYSGINILTLWMSSELQGFVSPFWMTFKQALELGGHVKKGEHGSPVVYASTFKKKEESDDGQETKRKFRSSRNTRSFVPTSVKVCRIIFYATVTPPTEMLPRIEQADAFFANTKADIRVGGDGAFYAMDADYVRMPPFETFRDAESHAATLAHEMTNWTRHPSRLAREFGRKRWGDEGYAIEELVAELGSAFLCADLQITPEVREDHASYINSWLKVLKDDKRAVFTAASHAAKGEGIG
ncbi:MAG: traC [Schlesneria sp.]|nr:traC [Schlesneria sp.]